MADQSLTVLLIEDNPDFAQLVRRWLAPNGLSGPDFVVVVKDSLMAGLQRLEQGGIDVVLLDLGLPDSSGYETLFRTKALSTGVPIIVLSAEDDESVALQMVQKGAQDYLVKNTCKAETLSKAIRYAVVRQIGLSSPTPTSTLARTIGVIGAKGGVGATTFACNLAAELRRQTEAETLLVDLDVNAGLVGFMTNVAGRRSLMDVILNSDHLDQTCWKGIVEKGPENMEILRSPTLLGREQLDPAQIREILSAVRPFYRWIVLDLGRLTDFSLRLLGQNDEVYLHTTSHLLALFEAKRIVERLRDIGFTMDRLRLIVRNVGNAAPIQDADLDRVFGLPVDLRQIDAERELHDAYNAGTLPSPEGSLRTQIAGLSRRIAGLPVVGSPKRRSHFWNRTATQESKS